MKDIFIGRQPVYNRNLGVYGYELLYRDSSSNSAGQIVDEDAATSQVIVNTFLDMGLDKLVGTSKACINLTPRLLTHEDALPLPAERVILDIPPNIIINDETLPHLQRLKDAGFTFALDGAEKTPDSADLLKLVDIYNIDIQTDDRQAHAARLKQLKKYDIQLRALKVQTLDEYEDYMHMGFDYFQGYFLSHPRILTGKTLETNKLSIMHLLSTLHSSKSETAEIEDAVSSDLSISYKLLKLINSAFFNLPSEVESVKRAVVILGRRKITSWASMLALSGLSDQPAALIKVAMVRARTCEQIASRLGLNDNDQFFTVGMFSALDVLMQRPLEVLVNPLPLTDDVKQAILHHKGPPGIALKASQLLETADAHRVSIKGIPRNELAELYIDADNWAHEVTQAIL